MAYSFAPTIMFGVKVKDKNSVFSVEPNSYGICSISSGIELDTPYEIFIKYHYNFDDEEYRSEDSMLTSAPGSAGIFERSQVISFQQANWSNPMPIYWRSVTNLSQSNFVDSISNIISSNIGNNYIMDNIIGILPEDSTPVQNESLLGSGFNDAIFTSDEHYFLLLPVNKKKFAFYSVNSEVIQEFGPELDPCDGIRFKGGILGVDNKILVVAQNSLNYSGSNKSYVIDRDNGTVEEIILPLNKYIGGCLLPDGRFFIVGYNYDVNKPDDPVFQGIYIDSVSMEILEIWDIYNTSGLSWNLKDGSEDEYGSITMTPTGDIFCIPSFEAVNYPVAILVLHPVSKTSDNIGSTIDTGYTGSCLLPLSQKIFCVPKDHTNILMIDYVNMSSQIIPIDQSLISFDPSEYTFPIPNIFTNEIVQMGPFFIDPSDCKIIGQLENSDNDSFKNISSIKLFSGGFNVLYCNIDVNNPTGNAYSKELFIGSNNTDVFTSFDYSTCLSHCINNRF